MNNVSFKEIEIPVQGVLLKADLSLTPQAKGLVVFAHGNGSSRRSIRNRAVASFLQENHFATLLFDLLTAEEGEDANNKFDIGLISGRLIEVSRWVKENEETRDYPLGFFGASTGAAAALNASARLNFIKAVVSRGGRPDMSLGSLWMVKVPTLLIVGSLDVRVIELNHLAFNKLAGVKKIEIIDGATHLFEEPGKMDEVMRLAADWFTKYLF